MFFLKQRNVKGINYIIRKIYLQSNKIKDLSITAKKQAVFLQTSLIPDSLQTSILTSFQIHK